MNRLCAVWLIIRLVSALEHAVNRAGSSARRLVWLVDTKRFLPDAGDDAAGVIRKRGFIEVRAFLKKQCAL